MQGQLGNLAPGCKACGGCSGALGIRLHLPNEYHPCVPLSGVHRVHASHLNFQTVRAALWWGYPNETLLCHG